MYADLRAVLKKLKPQKRKELGVSKIYRGTQTNMWDMH